MDIVSKDTLHGLAIGKKNSRETNMLAGDLNSGEKSEENRVTVGTHDDSASMRFNSGARAAANIFKESVGFSKAIKSDRFRLSGSPATHPFANAEVHIHFGQLNDR